jgi:hypothetical protein
MPVTAAADTPDQGEPDLVLTIDDPSVECDSLPGEKVERGNLGRYAEARSSDPIDKVTVKSGAGAQVLRRETRHGEGTYLLAFELDKDIGNFVIWTCPGVLEPSPPPQQSPGPAEPDSSSPPDDRPVGDGPATLEALRARFPSTVGDFPVQISAFTGEDWLAGVDGTAEIAAARTALEALAAAAGLSVDEIAIVSGLIEPATGDHVVVAAVGLPDTDARALVREVVGLMLGDVDIARILPESLAGRNVLRVTDAAEPGGYPRYLLVDGDTVWVVEADEPLRSQILEALP